MSKASRRSTPQAVERAPLRVIGPLDEDPLFPRRLWARARGGVAREPSGSGALDGDRLLASRFRLRATGRFFVLGELLGALRAAGLRPPDDGADLALAVGMLGPTSAREPDFEESNTPTVEYLGLAEGDFVQNGPSELGDYAQQLRDVAAMKAGRIRRAGQSEATFGATFSAAPLVENCFQFGEQVPTPAQLRERLSAHGFQRLVAAQNLILLCACQDVQLDLTVFNGCAGLSLNYSGNRRSTDAIPYTNVLESPHTYGEVAKGKPDWQSGFLVPSGYGWDEWYYAFAGSESATAPEQLYQQYALNVFATPPKDASPYAEECARRKSLAVAAFAYTVGEWLAGMDLVLKKAGLGTIANVVSIVEIANEPEQFWRTDDAKVESTGRREAARYMALIAGPLRAWLPGLRFRTELGSWFDLGPDGSDSDHAARVAWLADLLATELPDELTWWADLVRARSHGASTAEEQAWLDTTAEADAFAWPPASAPDGSAYAAPAPGDLVHEVGYHWYHGFTRTPRGGVYAGYLPAGHRSDGKRPGTGTIGDAETLITAMTAARLSAYALTFTVGEIGFPAVDPGVPKGGWSPEGGPYTYAGTSDLLQAAMLARVALVLLATGIDRVKLFTFNYGNDVRSESSYPAVDVNKWGFFYSNGVHNEFLYKLDATAAHPPRLSYEQGADCWPRPAWYTWRRLCWIFAHIDNTRAPAASVSVVHDADGLTVVAVEFTGSGLMFQHERWRRAYVIWLDQFCDDRAYFRPPRGTTTATVYFEFTEEGYEGIVSDPYVLLPLVPAVTPPGSPDPDANGYARVGRDWTWTGWDSALVDDGWVRADRGSYDHLLRLRIAKCAPETGDALVPLVVLTDGSFVRAE